ncbi:MAG TPA: type III polyketide synthase [Dissulfurispiraceae bacterium]|nr:type III polyketide synthase [Dissulfurispiraceae bacterium]
MLRNDHTFISSLGLATPPFSVGQEAAGQILEARTGHLLSDRSLSVMRKLFEHPSINSRSFAVSDSAAIFDEDADARTKRFTDWSVALSAEAATVALANAGVSIDEVKGLVVNTCTGYICPGISTYLIEKLELPKNVRAYDLLGSGCGGAIPNLQLADAINLRTGGGAVVSVSVEICSATFQMADDLSLVVSNSLFGDGAAAAVMTGQRKGLEILDSASRFAPEDREFIRYIHKNGQLHNQLLLGLQTRVSKAANLAVSDLLLRNSLQTADIRHWALHTGGEKIINSIRDKIGLSEEQLAATRSILRDYGNMSSPTVLFVLDRLIENGMREGDLCMLVAFGAGLSAHACLLKKT